MAKKLVVTGEWLKYAETKRELKLLQLRLENKSNEEIAKELGVSKRTVSYTLKKIHDRMRSKNVVPDNGKECIATQDDLYIIKGTSTLYDSEGNIKLQWVKTELDKENYLKHLQSAIKELIKDIEDSEWPKYLASSIKTDEKIYDKDIITIYPIGDLHLGMFSWEGETNEDYDLKIAEEIISKAFERMIASAPTSETAIMANLGDFFHIDNVLNETLTHGNKLDADTRYPKILSIGLKILVKIITLLLTKHKKIIVRNTPGNHDFHSAIFLNEYIRAWFKNNERVIIEDNASMIYWYYKFGKNLFGITHGDGIKMEDLPLLMATEKPDLWGETEFRYWLIGHVHHMQRKEIMGCTIESFGVLAAKDFYHYKHGYRAQRQIKFKVYHKEYGEIQENTVTLKNALGN